MVAPALLLYTSGYRYNTKKQMLERFGALIIDGTVDGARISLNGIDTGEVSPHEFTRLVPGWYDVTLERPGYSTWNKRLEVKPERVSFANAITQYRLQEPAFVFASDIKAITPSPNNRRLALLTENASSSYAFGFWANEQFTRTASISIPLTQPQLNWDLETGNILLHGASNWWWGDTRGILTKLPYAEYAWNSDDRLYGVTTSSLWTINPRDREFQQTQRTVSSTYSVGSLSFTPSPTSTRLNWDKLLQHETVTLPSTRVVLRHVFDVWRVLEDPLTHRFYVCKEGATTCDTFTAQKIRFSPHPTTGEFTIIGIDGGEAFAWTATSGRELLWRQTTPFRDIAWHPSYNGVLLADATHLAALELDPRDGREYTPLATFDTIQGIAITNDLIYIAASKGEQNGLWTLSLE